MKILVVDDESTVLEIIGEMLVAVGHSVERASNAKAAFFAIDKELFDLVLTDIRMSGLSGIDVLKYVRERQLDTDVILMTAYSEIDSAIEGIRLGAFDYLHKPIDYNDLKHAVGRSGEHIRLVRENRNYQKHLEKLVAEKTTELKALVELLEEKVRERTSQLIHSERMASLGTMAAGIAHEINNPTTFIRGNVQILTRHWDKITGCIVAKLPPAGKSAGERLVSEIPDMLESMRLGTDRIMAIVEGLREYSAPDKLDFEEIDVRNIIDAACELTANEVRFKLDVRTVFAPIPIAVRCAPRQLEQVFVNLILNANQAVEKRGVLTISAERQGVEACLVFENSGSAIDERNIDRIFEPFFTSKQADGHTGLGLSICRRIVSDHGGSITAENAPRNGENFVRFSIRLPAADVKGKE